MDLTMMDKVSRKLINPHTGKIEAILSKYKLPKPLFTPKVKPKVKKEDAVSINPTSFEVHIYKKCLLSTLRQFLKDRHITHDHPDSRDYKVYAILLHEDDRVRTKKIFDSLLATLDDESDPMGVKRTEAYDKRYDERRVIFQNGLDLGSVKGDGDAEEKIKTFELKLEKEKQDWSEKLNALELPKLRSKAVAGNLKREEWKRKKAEKDKAAANQARMERMAMNTNYDVKEPENPIVLDTKLMSAGEIHIAVLKILREHYPKDMKIAHPAWEYQEYCHWAAYISEKDERRVLDNVKKNKSQAKLAKAANQRNLKNKLLREQKSKEKAKLKQAKCEAERLMQNEDYNYARRLSDEGLFVEDDQVVENTMKVTGNGIKEGDEEKKDLMNFEEFDKETLFVSATSKKEIKIWGENSLNNKQYSSHSKVERQSLAILGKRYSPVNEDPEATEAGIKEVKETFGMAEYESRETVKNTSPLKSIFKPAKAIAASMDSPAIPASNSIFTSQTTKRKNPFTASPPSKKRERRAFAKLIGEPDEDDTVMMDFED